MLLLLLLGGEDKQDRESDKLELFLKNIKNYDPVTMIFLVVVVDLLMTVVVVASSVVRGVHTSSTTTKSDKMLGVVIVDDSKSSSNRIDIDKSEELQFAVLETCACDIEHCCADCVTFGREYMIAGHCAVSGMWLKSLSTTVPLSSLT